MISQQGCAHIARHVVPPGKPRRGAKSQLSWEGQQHHDREQKENASKSEGSLNSPFSLADLGFSFQWTTIDTLGTQEPHHHHLCWCSPLVPSRLKGSRGQAHKPPTWSAAVLCPPPHLGRNWRLS